MLGNLLYPTLKCLAKETIDSRSLFLYMHTKHNHTMQCLTRRHSWFLCSVSVLCSTNCMPCSYNGHGEQPQHSKIDSIRITAIIFSSLLLLLCPFFLMPMQKEKKNQPHESNTANNGIKRTMRKYESFAVVVASALLHRYSIQWTTGVKKSVQYFKAIANRWME